jgi:hypothetical protein
MSTLQEPLHAMDIDASVAEKGPSPEGILGAALYLLSQGICWAAILGGGVVMLRWLLNWVASLAG